MSDPEAPRKPLVGPTPGLTFAELTDVGRTRDENQDALGHRLDEDVALFIVCDGMGGHAGGSTASNLAVESALIEFAGAVGQPVRDRLEQAIGGANAKVHEKSRVRGPLKGMGTTIVALAIPRDKPLGYVAHVGDSRAYLVRRDRLTRLTRDHSMVQLLVDDGILSEDEAAGHPHSNVISRSLGSGAKVDIDHEEPIALCEGDIFLLCSDGLSGRVRELEMAQLAWELAPQEACQALIDLANERGGNDNISVQIVRVGRRIGEPLADPLEIVHPPIRNHRSDVESTQTGGRVLDVKAIAPLLAEPADPAQRTAASGPPPADASFASAAAAEGEGPRAAAETSPALAAGAGLSAPASAAAGVGGSAHPIPAATESVDRAQLLPALILGLAIGLLAFLAVYLAVTRLAVGSP